MPDLQHCRDPDHCASIRNPDASVQVCNQSEREAFRSMLDLYSLITAGDGSGTWQEPWMHPVLPGH